MFIIDNQYADITRNFGKGLTDKRILRPAIRDVKRKAGAKKGRVATMKLTKPPPLGPVFDLKYCYMRVQLPRR